MGIFKWTSKDKKGNRQVRFAYVDGIPNLFTIEHETVDVTIDTDSEKLIIQSAINKKATATLDLQKITDVRDVTDRQIVEANKSVIGRAIVGTLLLGPLGGIVGGMSGIGGKKEKKVAHNFVVISYTSNEESKQIILEIVGASMGWVQFVAELPKDPNSPFAPPQSCAGNRPVEL